MGNQEKITSSSPSTGETVCLIGLTNCQPPITPFCGVNSSLTCISQSLEDEVKEKAPCSSCTGDSLKNKQGSTEFLGKMKEAVRQATVDETNWSTQEVCMIHKEDLSHFCLEDQVPLCSLCRKSWDHAAHTVISRNQPENQATGNVLNGGKDGFPKSQPTDASMVEFSNINKEDFIEKGGATDGNKDDKKDNKPATVEQWVDFSLEEKKEAGTQPNTRVKNSITWIVLILFVIQIVGLVTTIFVFTKAKPHLPSAAATTSCCPTGWHNNQGNCYHVMETKDTWNASQNHCLSFGATLAVFGDLEKLIGAMNVREPFNHWVGLHRSPEESWKWPDGTLFKNPFEVEGDGPCAYLKKRVVSSADCADWKKGLCSLKGLMNHQLCSAT
ncbi:uncharacterized protein LOC120314235 isoform X1 [Crotalus tigris]|uniref:uncharacterized protein LOC120314235 isoform X1 n=2 Tax=Crotalus tigris TaxID=88082 RepID=UPI00192F2A8F|nr:uncharacterized protein LOC120314235 isoform X1 [Crotalus tigris]